MKLLVVDDDKDILNLIKVFLKGKDFDIITSGNGEEAYRIIAKDCPDVAIIDGLIPGIHGFELCKKVKEDPALKNPPRIILMSSLYKGMKYKLDAMKTYHADNYLPKPFTKEELLAKIESVVS